MTGTEPSWTRYHNPKEIDKWNRGKLQIDKK